MNASSSKSETMNENKKSDQKMEATRNRSEKIKKSADPTKKDVSAFKAKRVQYSEPKSLPERMKNLYDKKNSSKYSQAEKVAKQVQKRERDNKVGFQERTHHRHPHQAARQQAYFNYANGFPLDFDPDDPYVQD